MPLTFREVQPVIAHALEHLDDDLSLSVLAQQARMSPFHLHRTFSAVTGETPKRMMQRLRLGRAAGLLLTTKTTVLDVALVCGFQSHEAFSRAFRRHFRITPRAYRERGLINAQGLAQARQHAEFVNQIGPCVRLYQMSEAAKPKENPMRYSIATQKLNPQPVLVIRRRVKRSEIAAAIGEALPHLFLYAQQNGIALAGHPFTRYAEMGPGLVTMEPGMRIAGSLANPITIHKTPENGVIASVLPGGLAATVTHVGSYEGLQDAYAAIEQWIETEGLAAGGAPWESYVTDPAEYPDPKDWKTEIFWPLAGAEAGPESGMEAK